ncbi:MAG: hypothetical protein JKY37_04615 [Nannocystaceae bacterium]|nr:hypothetical protein [Nannocystaceae bacterium]
MLPGDQFIHQQLGTYLAGEPAVYTAYLETATSGGVIGTLARKAYWGALTASRLYLIETSVGAFNPTMENKGVRCIERSTILGVHTGGTKLTLALAGGETLDLIARPDPKHASGQAYFLAELSTRHGAGKVADGLKKRSTLKRVGGVVVGVLVAGYFAASALYLDKAEVAINCNPRADTIACTAEHTSGGASAKACWRIELSCANGERPVARVCTDVDKAESAEVVLEEADFSKFDQCDSVTGLELKGLEIKPQ